MSPVPRIGTLFPDRTFEAADVDIAVAMAIAVSDKSARPGNTLARYPKVGSEPGRPLAVPE
jgi:hypothetical protein